MKLRKFEIDYGKLYSLAKERREEKSLESDLYVFKKFLDSNYEAKTFLEDMSIAPENRLKALREIFPASSRIFWDLLGFIIENEEESIVSEVSEKYTRYLAHEDGIDFAELILSQEVSNDYLEKIKEKIGKNASFKIMINPRILGGFIVRKVDGTVIDGSLQGRLRQLRRSLHEIKFV